MCFQPWIEIQFTPSWDIHLKQQKMDLVTVHRNQTFYMAANFTRLTANVENIFHEKYFVVVKIRCQQSGNKFLK